jgi:hypothetical protein
MFYRTDIKTLFQYESAWKAIISYGAVTLYVDATNGSDAVGQGYGSGADACATLQFAFDLIPPINGGNVTINMTAETYAENAVIGGKGFSGPYTITINGTMSTVASLTATGGTQGATTAKGTITGTGFSTGWANKFVKGTSGANNGNIWVIDTATTTLLTIVDYFTGAPVNLDTFDIIEPGTIVTTLTVNPAQIGVLVNNIRQNLPNTNSSLYRLSSEATFTYCQFICTTGGSILPQISSLITNRTCYFEKVRILAADHSKFTAASTKFKNGANGVILNTTSAKIQLLTPPSVLDGEGTLATGITAAQNGLVSCGALYNSIRNFTTTGLSAASAGVIVSTSNNQYSGNTANETATAASYGYIG